MIEDTPQERDEKMFREFLHILNEEAFISSTNSVTGETTEFPDAVEDLEAVIRIKGEWDTEALRDAVIKFLATQRESDQEKIEKALISFPALDKYVQVVKEGSKDDMYELGYNMARADFLVILKWKEI